jgi:hypothetical protein
MASSYNLEGLDLSSAYKAKNKIKAVGLFLFLNSLWAVAALFVYAWFLQPIYDFSTATSFGNFISGLGRLTNTVWFYVFLGAIVAMAALNILAFLALCRAYKRRPGRAALITFIIFFIPLALINLISGGLITALFLICIVAREGKTVRKIIAIILAVLSLVICLAIFGIMFFPEFTAESIAVPFLGLFGMENISIDWVPYLTLPILQLLVAVFQFTGCISTVKDPFAFYGALSRKRRDQVVGDFVKHELVEAKKARIEEMTSYSNV